MQRSIFCSREIMEPVLPWDAASHYEGSEFVFDNMFHLHVSMLEKILRPIIVYLCLVIFLRLFGKRELAQLNPFDLIVLLCLSNTVQNSIIGDDNTVSGGIIGVFSLLGINFLLTRLLFRFPKLNSAIEGRETVLILHGKVK